MKPLSTSVPWSLTLFREVNLQRTHQENTRLPCRRRSDCPLFLGIEGREGGCGTSLGGAVEGGKLAFFASCHAHLSRGEAGRSGTLDTQKRV